MVDEKESGIAFIGNGPESPFELFKEWYKDAQIGGHPNPQALTFSTCSEDGQPSSRTLLLRRLDDDGFVVVTDKRSKKSKQLERNPKVAVVFLWIFYKNGRKETKQVRLEGEASMLDPSEYAEIYEKEPLFCKLRSYVCHQGQPVTWEEQKQTHDQLYQQFRDGENLLPMPDWFIGYKVHPTMFDFYYAFDSIFADRLCYLKSETNEWRHFRIAA